MRHFRPSLIFFLITSGLISEAALSESKLVSGILIRSLAQLEDDEEAPFDIISSNKAHRCGGKSSSLFRVYSEDPEVGRRRFLLALEALKSNLTLTLTTDGCDGLALQATGVQLDR